MRREKVVEVKNDSNHERHQLQLGIVYVPSTYRERLTSQPGGSELGGYRPQKQEETLGDSEGDEGLIVSSSSLPSPLQAEISLASVYILMCLSILKQVLKQIKNDKKQNKTNKE